MRAVAAAPAQGTEGPAGPDVLELIREWRERHLTSPLKELLVLGHAVDLPGLEAYAIPLARGLGARVAVLQDAGATGDEPPTGPAGWPGHLYGTAEHPGGLHAELVLLLGEDSCRIAVGPGRPAAPGADHRRWTVVATDDGTSHPLVADLADWLDGLPDAVAVTPEWAERLRHLAELLTELHCAAPPSEPAADDVRLAPSAPGYELTVIGAATSGAAEPAAEPLPDAPAPAAAPARPVPPAAPSTARVAPTAPVAGPAAPAAVPAERAGTAAGNGAADTTAAVGAPADAAVALGSETTAATAAAPAGPDPRTTTGPGAPTDPGPTTGPVRAVDPAGDAVPAPPVTPATTRAEDPAPAPVLTPWPGAGEADGLFGDPVDARRFEDDLTRLREFVLGDSQWAPAAESGASHGPALSDDAREQARTRLVRLARQLAAVTEPADPATAAPRHRTLPAALPAAELHLHLLAAGVWDEDDYGWRPVSAELIRALAAPGRPGEPEPSEALGQRVDAVIAVLMSLLGLHADIEGADADPTAAGAWRLSRPAVGRARPEDAADLYLPAGRRGAPVATGEDVEALGKRARAVPDPVAEARRALAAAGLSATYEAGIWELAGVFNNPQAACAKAVTLLAGLPDAGWPGPALARARGPRFPCFMAWHRPLLVRQVGRQWTTFRITAPGTPLAAFQSGAPRPVARDDQARRELGPLLEAAGLDVVELFLHLSGAPGLPG
ncbi:hypothetical protein [Streptomyces sp. NPDC089919]|uniref:hypothetical protein n=1 Tax=Streptomyces sp. NPDC089919 TaxID=3155188 RepID=UPI0034376AA4